MKSNKKFEGSSAISKGLGNALEVISEVGSLPLVSGQWYFVDPTNGSNNSDGRTITTCLANLTVAYDKAVDGDGIALLSYGATSAATTSYLTQELAWTKNGITVVGVCAPTHISPRARVANKAITSTVAMVAVADTSLTRTTGSFITDGWVAGMIAGTNVNTSGVTIVTVTALVMTISGTLTVGAHTSITSYNVNLMTLSGSNNRFYNVQFWNGGATATELGGVVISGERNYFNGCHIVGSAGVASATAKSLHLNVGSENFFENCVIGTDTVDRGNNACAEITLTGLANRNRFKDCEVLFRVDTGTAACAVRSVSTTSASGTVFDRCVFNATFGATTPAALHLVTTNAADILTLGCAAFNFSAWGAQIFVPGAAAAASAGGSIATKA